MFATINVWLSSGKTQRQFCAEASLAFSVFQYWLKKYREQGHVCAAGFAEISASSALPGIEIVYPNGVFLRLPGGSELGILRSLLTL